MSRKLHIFGFLLALFVLSVTAIVFTPQSAFAQGGVGSGGSGGGCGNGCGGAPHTNNGYGWYRFSSSGAGGPADLRNGGSYANVAATCRNTGNDSVIAFIVLRPNRLITSSSIYDYKAGTFGTYTDYNGNDGGNWLSYATAGALYSSLPGNLTAGYSFGSNVAWFCYNFAPPPPPQWTVEGYTYIQNSAHPDKAYAQGGTLNAKPGDQLNWFHDLRNLGPNGMERSVYFEVAKTGFTNGWNGIIQPNGNASGNPGTIMDLRAKDGIPSDPYTVYYVQQSDVGNTLCQRIQWISHAWNNGAAGANGFACAAVPFSYALVPEITNTDGAPISSAQGPLPVTARVTNTGDTKSHPNIQWQVSQVKYAPTVNPIPRKTGGPNVADPCTYFRAGLTNAQTSCSPVSTSNVAAGYGYHESQQYDVTGALNTDEPVGTKVCFAMSVKRGSSVNADWEHSSLKCSVVGKKPKVQVLGGDLSVGRGAGVTSTIITSTSKLASDGRTYGSWGEYGISASGLVTGMASGAGYTDGALAPQLCGLSILTFTNSNAGSCNDATIGRYANSSLAPNIGSRFPLTATTPNIGGTTATVGSMQGLYKTSSATLSLAGGTAITPGRWVVINVPDTTVIINSDISYAPGPISGITNIPQVVIIAKNIIIADTVTNVDAWLIATGAGVDGKINTCAAGTVNESTVITANNCSSKLTVNGPVMANHLIMRRTAGAGIGAQARDPAEVFNLRPDAYFWAATYSNTTSRVPTAAIKELPPRF